MGKRNVPSSILPIIYLTIPGSQHSVHPTMCRSNGFAPQKLMNNNLMTILAIRFKTQPKFDIHHDLVNLRYCCERHPVTLPERDSKHFLGAHTDFF